MKAPSTDGSSYLCGSCSLSCPSYDVYRSHNCAHTTATKRDQSTFGNPHVPELSKFLAHGTQFNPIPGGKKFDSGKAPMELLSHQALLQIAKVFGHGAEKYGRYNYRAGLSWSRVIGAAYRHLGAFNSGEDLDPESGLSHIAHLGCCVIMLLDYVKDNPNLDDRYKCPTQKEKI